MFDILEYFLKCQIKALLHLFSKKQKRLKIIIPNLSLVFLLLQGKLHKIQLLTDAN